MKKLLSIGILLLACFHESFSQGNPAVSSIGFAASPLYLGAQTTLTAVVANATFSSGTVPAGQFEVQLTLPSNQVYTLVNGNTASPTMVQISDNNGNNFSWVGDGEGYYVGTSTKPVAQGAQITITATVYGRTISTNTAATVNVQGLMGTAITNIPGDDNTGTTLSIIAGPLSVRMKDFSATAVGCAALIRWQTASDESFDHFEIEYSTDGTNYQQAGVVKSKGSVAGSSYDFSYAPPSGRSYYRLKLVGVNGSYAYTQSISATINCTTRPVTASPNPTRSTVRLSGVQQGQLLQVFDVTGRQLVGREIMNDNEILDLEQFAPGIYRLVLSRGTERQSLQVLRIE